MGAKNTLAGVILAVLLCVPAHSARQHARRMRSAEPARTELKSEEINDAGLVPPLVPGAHGSPVARAQILLDRQHFSSGQIDGQYGSNLGKAVAAFQAARNLSPSGSVDAETWAALNVDRSPVLTPYEITPQDVAGPFVKVPSDMMEQAALPALGYESVKEELAERFHASPKLLAALNPAKQLDKAGEQIMAPNVNTPAPDQAASLVVSKSESSVAALDRAGHVIAWYAATIGSEHDPLPIGDWKIKGVQRNPPFHYNPVLFWDANATDQRATIKPGPNNPVGLVWIALTKDHYGIHGTPDPEGVGHTASHGCIRLTNWDAVELAAMVKFGTPAVFKE